MSDYTTTKARIFQWVGIVLILAVFAGAYWYFQVYGSTLNAPQNDLNTNGLVGLWSFNGDDISGTTAYDRGTGGNNGTLTNAPQVTQGIVGQALNFFPNGSDTDAYVTIGDPGDGDLDFGSGDFSVGFWMKSNGYSSQGSSVNAAVAKHNLDAGNTAAGYSFYYASTNLMNFVIGNGTTAYTTTQTVSTTADNQWHQYTGVRSGSTMYLYIDGILVTSTTVSGSVSNGTGFCIGDTCGGIRNVNGSIDEVRVYNRAIAASEVASLYAQGGGTKSNTSVSQPQGTGRLDSGLAGYWKLDDGSGTSATDSSTNGNTGTLTSGPTWSTGQIGGAVTFDGVDDYIDTDNGSSLDSMSEYTYAAWIYPTSADGFIIAKASNGGGSSGFRLTSSTLQGWRANFSNWAAARSTSSTTVSLNTWSHVVMTYSHTGDKKHRIYLNGVEVVYSEQDINPAGLDPDSDYDFWIGRKQGSNEMVDVPFTGNIDDARIYNRALSADEVGQLYRLNSPTGVDTGLKGYWSFNAPDMASTTAYDRSGAGNTGTLTNGPAITEGKLGQALDYDGADDYITIPDSPTLEALDTEDMTLTGWFYRDTFTTDDVIISKRLSFAAAHAAHVVYIDDATDKLVFETSDGTDEYQLESVSTFTSAGWYHFAVVWDQDSSENSEIFIDGIDNNATDTGTIGNIGSATNSSPLSIGAQSDGDSTFDGKIDEVRSYERTLTAAEIKGLYDTGESDRVNSSVSQAQGTGRLDSDLVAYWPFDDGTGSTAVDVSTNSFDGSASGGPTWTTGQIGGAAYFDGSARFTNSSSTAVALNPIDGESFTLAGWFNRDTFTGDDTLLAKRAGQSVANEGYIVYIDGTTDKVTFEVSDDVDEYQLESVSTFTATGWHHVVVSWNDVSGAALYINGVAEAATVTGTFTNINDLTSATGLALGADSIATNLFNGSLDEIRIYGRALSGDEVAQLYRLTSPTGTETSLKGYWSFNGQDVSGTTAYDRSGAGNTGTLTNGPAITEGRSGQALSFDGTDDYVSIADSDVFTPSTISVAFWSKSDTISTQPVYIHRSSDSSRIDIFVGPNIYCTFSNGTTYNTGFYSSTWDTSWHYVVCMWDGTTVSTYLDGVLVKTESFSGTLPNISASVNIGRRSSTSSYFDGSIDEVRVYNRTLTAAEIKGLYNSSR